LCDVVRKNVLLHRPNAWPTSPIEQALRAYKQAYLPCSLAVASLAERPFGLRVLDGEGNAP
jgi:hypothetical protein